MHEQIECLIRKIRYRNWQETAAAAFVALFFGSQLLGGNLQRLDGIGRLVILAGAGWVVFALWK